MSFKDALLLSIHNSTNIVDGFAGDLDRRQLHHRPVAGANCAAWVLGHLIDVEHHALIRLNLATETDLPPLPFDDFHDRFGRDEAAASREDYGEAELLPELFVATRKAMTKAVEVADVKKLHAPLPKPHPRGDTSGELLLFFTLHATLHAGQLTTIRRSLGLPIKV